jgi:uncharacterized membrane protein
MAQAPSFAKALASLAIGIAAALFVLAAPTPAAAQQAATDGWVVCNETSYIIETAVGRPDGRAVMVRGWVRLLPGECRQAAPQPLARGVHYLYGRTSAAHRGGLRQWGGDATLCVNTTASFQGQNPSSCSQIGLVERGFRRVNINQPGRWRTSFAEATPFTLARARQQGLQRLLVDAGYDVRGPSGVTDVRRLSAAIEQFRTEANLPVSATDDQLMNALESVARRRTDQFGLQLCNRTPQPIWTAIARRRGEGWESRGWWQVASGDCATTIDEALLQGFYFVHAVMETPQGERKLATSGEAFCISPAKFAIIGREDCDRRFFDSALFTAVRTDGKPGLIIEFAERDFLPPGIEPQRASGARAVDVPGPAAPVQAPDRGVERGARPAPAPAKPPAAQTQPGGRVGGALGQPKP